MEPNQLHWIGVAHQKIGEVLRPWIECVLCVLVEKRGFAHTRVAKGQELDQVVIVHRVCLLLQPYSQITFSSLFQVHFKNFHSLLN